MAEMLRAVPDGWSSNSLTVFDRGGTTVARIELPRRSWGESAKLEIGESHYEAHSKGRTGKEFVLATKDGQAITVVEKPSVWRSRLIFEYANNHYELKKASVWGSAFVLLREGVGPVGSIRSKGLFKREWTVEMPEELPLEVRVFIMWLMIILYKRAMAAAGAGGAGASSAVQMAFVGL